MPSVTIRLLRPDTARITIFGAAADVTPMPTPLPPASQAHLTRCTGPPGAQAGCRGMIFESHRVERTIAAGLYRRRRAESRKCRVDALASSLKGPIDVGLAAARRLARRATMPGPQAPSRRLYFFWAEAPSAHESPQRAASPICSAASLWPFEFRRLSPLLRLSYAGDFRRPPLRRRDGAPRRLAASPRLSRPLSAARRPLAMPPPTWRLAFSPPGRSAAADDCRQAAIYRPPAAQASALNYH